MTKCANCQRDAAFQYRVTDTFKILYCEYHLPKFVYRAGRSGMVTPIESVVEAPKPSKKTVKVSAPVEEETPVVEEPAVVEETPVVEETAPLEE